jgi:hypothetical protein
VNQAILAWSFKTFPTRSIDFPVKNIVWVRNIASQGPGKYDPDGRFVHGRFVPTDVLSPRTFCPHGRFDRRTFCPTDLLSPRTFCPTDVLSLRTFCPHGRFVPTDVLSTDVLSPDGLSPDVLSGHRKISTSK